MRPADLKCVGLNPDYVIYWLLTFVAKYLFEENSAVQSQEEITFLNILQHKRAILNCDNISQYYCFYCCLD